MISSIIKKIMPFLNKNIPTDIAEKAISKISPNLGKFLKSGVEKGLPIVGGLSFLRSQFGRENQQIDPTLRPDEKAAQVEQEREKNLGNTLKSGTQLAASAAAAGPLGGAALAGGEVLGNMLGGSEQTPEQTQQAETPIPDQKPVETIDKSILDLYEKAKKSSTGSQFLKFANKLIKSKNIDDVETFGKFFNWWNSTNEEKKGTPEEEFERFLFESGGMTANQAANFKRNQKAREMNTQVPSVQPQNSQAAPGAGQQSLIGILNEIRKSRGG